MKYTIEGFNQAYATTLTAETTINGKTVTRKIDCTDLVLLRWFVDFYPKMKKVEIDGKQYAFVSHKKVLDDIPILGVTPKAIIDRMKKMVFFGILDYKFLKDNGSISVYGFGENYIHLVESPIQQQTTGCTNDEGGSSSNVYPVAVQPHTDYSIIHNSIISKENIKRNENIVQSSFLANDENQVQNEKVDLETVTQTTTSSLIATNEQPSSQQKANKGTDTIVISALNDIYTKIESMYKKCGYKDKLAKKDTITRLKTICNNTNKSKRLHPLQILLSYGAYLAECRKYCKDVQYVKQSNFFLTSMVYDYAEKTANDFEQRVVEKYGDGWKKYKVVD